MLLRRRRSNITCLTIPAPIRAARQGILQEERQSHASRTGIIKSLFGAVVHAFLSLHFFAVSLLSNLPASQPGQPTCSLAWPTLVAYQRWRHRGGLRAHLSLHYSLFLLQPRSTAHPLARLTVCCIPQNIPHVWRPPPPPKLQPQTVGTASFASSPSYRAVVSVLASHGCMQHPLLPAYDEHDRLPGPDACTWVPPLPRACCRTSTCVGGAAQWCSGGILASSMQRREVEGQGIEGLRMLSGLA